MKMEETFTCPNCGRPMKKRIVKEGFLGEFETWDCPFCHP
jgi:ribosomal protein L37AE/L43A